MSTAKIPLVRAAFVIQFKTAMLNNGIDADAYFEKWHIPFSRFESPDQLIPELPFWKLVNDVAERENIPDFGIQVAQVTPWHQIESLAPLIQNCRNLRELLESFCEATASQSNVAAFNLTHRNSISYFEYKGRPLIKNDIQMEVYRVASMMDFIRYATGKRWEPDQVSLMMPDNTAVKKCKAFFNCRLSFGNEYSAVTFQVTDLERTLPIFSSATREEAANIDDEVKFIDSLRSLVSLSITENACTIEIIAELAGLSVRSLQRRLKAHDLCFNDIVNEERYSLARKFLSEPESPVTDIACQLGYNDPAHFSRAFRRWSGMSPSGFRAAQIRE